VPTPCATAGAPPFELADVVDPLAPPLLGLEALAGVFAEGFALVGEVDASCAADGAAESLVPDAAVSLAEALEEAAPPFWACS
jgi:hypothetical protein